MSERKLHTAEIMALAQKITALVAAESSSDVVKATATWQALAMIYARFAIDYNQSPAALSSVILSASFTCTQNAMQIVSDHHRAEDELRARPKGAQLQ